MGAPVLVPPAGRTRRRAGQRPGGRRRHLGPLQAAGPGQRLDLVLARHVVASMVHNAVSTVLVCGVAFLIGFLPDADPLESEEGRAWI